MAAASAQLVVSGLVRSGDSIVVVENASPRGPQWSAPGGKVEPGEGPVAAAVREIREECGLTVGLPRRLVHVSHLNFVTGSGAETWVSLGYEFVLDRPVELPGAADPDGVVGHAEWLTLAAAAERVGATAIPPVARSFVDYCEAGGDLVTRYYEFDVDLAREPSSAVVAYFDGLGLGAA